MTILEKNKMFNKLITTGHAERKEENDDTVFNYSLNGRIIHCIERFAEYDIIVDSMINSISHDAKRAYYIEEILKSVGIIIDDIEEKYNILITSSYDIVFCKKENNNYIFIEYYDTNYDSCCGYGKDIKVVKLNLDTNNLTYDHIDLIDMKYYHADDEISEYTLSKIDSWNKHRLTQNNLYDVIAKNAEKPKYGDVWTSMNRYCEFICDLDMDKLDKNICQIEEFENGKKKIYYL